MSERLIGIKDVTRATSLSTATIYRMIKAGKFPKQIYVGCRAVWVESRVQAWVDAVAAGEIWKDNDANAIAA
ncbi:MULTISPECIES: AlpA family transcriptional regulator [Microvirgula]|uniref:helix-turn-helix transcriptional regulator n=1 Tax=Microvirgula TaxID=57479 RepID=UPI000DC5262B|nr:MULTISPECIES: AlpA family phage regulatory protein [Microvirgula]RAS14868.1 AlpA family transcriptional regulator [Microvirgula sp. AG722]